MVKAIRNFLSTKGRHYRKHKSNMYKFKNIFSSKKYTLIATFVGLFFISVGLSLLVFYFVAPKTASNLISEVAKKSRFNLSLPKTAECPINGQKYTQPEADVWNTRRPVIQ